MAGAQQAVTLALCEPPADNDRKSFKIDAATGVTTVDRKYDPNEKVRIVIVNKNPFANNYKLVIQENELGEPALQRFISGAFPFVNNIVGKQTAAGAGAPQAPQAGDPQATTKAKAPCEGQLETVRKEITRADLEISNQDTQVQNELRGVVNSYTTLTSTIQPHIRIMAQEKIACATLKPKAEEFLSLVDGAAGNIATQPIREKAGKLQEEIDTQRGRVRVYEEAISAACREASRAQIRHWQNQISVTATNTAKVEAKLTEVETAIKSLKERRQVVEEVGSQAEAFYEVRHLRTFDSPTDVVVRLQARPQSSQKPEDFKDVTETVTLNFGGGPIFSVSAGIAFSQFEDRRYTRVQGLARSSPGAEPAPPVQAVVGLEEDSDWRTTPLVLLHARFWESGGGRFATHGSFGLSAKVENNDTAVEYLAGVSLSFAKSWFMTGGFYYGEIERLAGDLYEGAPLPEDVAQPPVKSDHDWKFGLAFSYRIQ